MTLARMYAEALSKAEQGKTMKETVQHLLIALKRRGHLKLLPRIVAEYEKLQERSARSKAYTKVTKEGEQTRMLLELYNKLITTNG